MSSPADKSSPRVSATLALSLLVLVNLFNYIDRQVLAGVEPEIRGELLTESTNKQAKFWMGLLGSAFLISYMLVAPLFGFLADRMSRWKLVGFGVILWSLASGASGFEWVSWGMAVGMAYWLLLVTRCFVGIGEAAYGPVAPAMIADLFPIEKRGKVMAWFYLAIPVGGALGYGVGEVVKNMSNWHYAFYCVVPPGLALGLWCFGMKDPPRGQTDPGVEAATRKPSLADYLFLLKIPSYTLNTLGMTMMTFAIGGLAYWMPEFLVQHEAGDVGPLGPRTFFGGITAVAGLLATLLGGMAGDWLRPRFAGSYFLVSGFALLFGFPAVLLMVWTSYPWTGLSWVMVFGAVFLLFFNTGPTNTILANVTHPSMRGSAFALNILIIHALGDVISPPLLGWIADETNIDVAFSVVSGAMLLGGVFWIAGTRFLERDTELAPTRLPG
jgi:MFS family permease